MNAIHHPARLRTDNVGSMLRPPALLAARADHAAGRIDAQALRRIEDAVIAEVIRLQQEIGLSVATDGEFRREIWWYDFVAALRGIRIESGGDAGKRYDHPLAFLIFASFIAQFFVAVAAAGEICARARSRASAAECGVFNPRPRPTPLTLAGGLWALARGLVGL
jgi:hypothetical protein